MNKKKVNIYFEDSKRDIIVPILENIEIPLELDKNDVDIEAIQLYILEYFLNWDIKNIFDFVFNFLIKLLENNNYHYIKYEKINKDYYALNFKYNNIILLLWLISLKGMEKIKKQYKKWVFNSLNEWLLKNALYNIDKVGHFWNNEILEDFFFDLFIDIKNNNIESNNIEKSEFSNFFKKEMFKKIKIEIIK